MVAHVFMVVWVCSCTRVCGCAGMWQLPCLWLCGYVGAPVFVVVLVHTCLCLCGRGAAHVFVVGRACECVNAPKVMVVVGCECTRVHDCSGWVVL